MDKKEALKEFGLSDKEIEVYLALLPLGKINIQQIAKRVDIPRTTIYNTLNFLTEKGFVSKILKDGISYFEAVGPNKFLDVINQKKEIILSALPELESLKKEIRESSNAELYEGFKGISSLLSIIFQKKQEVYYFGSYSRSVEALKHLPEHARRIRLDRKIPAKIVIDPFDEELFHKSAYKKITEMRFLDSLKDFPCMIFIAGDNVAIYTVIGELVGVLIKNKEISGAMKIIFDIYWKMAKPAKI